MAPSAIPPTTSGSRTGERSSRPSSSRPASRCDGSRRPSGNACCGRTTCGSRKVHQGTTYEQTFEGVARKLERLHVDKDEDQIPGRGQGGVSAAVHRAGVRRLRRRSAQRRGAHGELAGGWTIGGLVECELTELDRVLEELLARDDYEPICDVIATLVARMRGTLRRLNAIGVGYLSLNRGVPTLSARASG